MSVAGFKDPRLATSLEPEESRRVESEVERLLASVPARIWDGESLPVPIELIAREVYGLRVLLKNSRELKEAVGRPADDPVEVSGALLCDIGEIWVNSWEAEQSWGSPRTRFTIGHELGHYVMHRTGKPGIFCRGAADAEDPGLAPVPRPIPEVEANTFSAALLMPSGLVLPRLGNGPENDIGRIQADFAVSRKASERRIAALR